MSQILQKFYCLLLVGFALPLSAYEKAISHEHTNNNLIKKLKSLSKNSTIDEALKELPDDIVSNHVLMFDSQSLQQASYRYPRVLLYNADASLVITFNGSPDQRGYESLETMRFLPPPQSKFVFEQIVFKKDFEVRKKFLQQNQLKHELEALEDKDGLKIGPNASACITCHTKDPRPNWEPYSHWPGAYGQLDSRSLQLMKGGYTSFDFEQRPHAEFIKQTQNTAAVELPIFIESSKTKLRYSRIKNLKNHLPIDPKIGNRERMRSPMLSTFTVRLTEQNNFRILRMLENSPNWHYRKYLWFASIMPDRCDLLQDATKQIDPELSFTFDTWFSDPFNTPIEFSKKIEILLSGTGIEFWEASMSFRKGYNHVGFSSSGNWNLEFLHMLLHKDVDIKNLVRKTLGRLEDLEQDTSYLEGNDRVATYAPALSRYKLIGIETTAMCNALIAAAIKAKTNK